MTMRTTLPLDKVGPLFDGRHENPFEVLGPHEIVTAGRRELAVRAYLPGSTEAWLVESGACSFKYLRSSQWRKLENANTILTPDAANLIFQCARPGPASHRDGRGGRQRSPIIS